MKSTSASAQAQVPSAPVDADASNAEAEQLRRQLNQLGEELYQFLLGAVHDIRSAQRGVTTSAQLLQNLLGDSLSPEVSDIMARLIENAEKANAILVAAGNYASALPAAKSTFREVKTSSVVRDALVSLDAEVRRSGADVTQAELPVVWGDRDRLQDLFRRLIDNGLKYHGQSAPRIEIAAYEEGHKHPDEIMFTVRDYGIGIERKYQGELFRPFRRLHGPEIPGLGLGLVICRKIAETHGGRLWLESDAGSGTTVFFTLPPPA